MNDEEWWDDVIWHEIHDDEYRKPVPSVNEWFQNNNDTAQNQYDDEPVEIRVRRNPIVTNNIPDDEIDEIDDINNWDEEFREMILRSHKNVYLPSNIKK